jgi:hypothetical protein
VKGREKDEEGEGLEESGHTLKYHFAKSVMKFSLTGRSALSAANATMPLIRSRLSSAAQVSRRNAILAMRTCSCAC